MLSPHCPGHAGLGAAERRNKWRQVFSGRLSSWDSLQVPARPGLVWESSGAWAGEGARTEAGPAEWEQFSACGHSSPAPGPTAAKGDPRSMATPLSPQRGHSLPLPLLIRSRSKHSAETGLGSQNLEGPLTVQRLLLAQAHTDAPVWLSPHPTGGPLSHGQTSPRALEPGEQGSERPSSLAVGQSSFLSLPLFLCTEGEDSSVQVPGRRKTLSSLAPGTGPTWYGGPCCCHPHLSSGRTPPLRRLGPAVSTPVLFPLASRENLTLGARDTGL